MRQAIVFGIALLVIAVAFYLIGLHDGSLL